MGQGGGLSHLFCFLSPFSFLTSPFSLSLPLQVSDLKEQLAHMQQQLDVAVAKQEQAAKAQSELTRTKMQV